MLCINCGNDIRDDAVFCPICGSRVSDATAEFPSPEPLQPESAPTEDSSPDQPPEPPQPESAPTEDSSPDQQPEPPQPESEPTEDQPPEPPQPESAPTEDQPPELPQPETSPAQHKSSQLPPQYPPPYPPYPPTYPPQYPPPYPPHYLYRYPPRGYIPSPYTSPEQGQRYAPLPQDPPPRDSFKKPSPGMIVAIIGAAILAAVITVASIFNITYSFIEGFRIGWESSTHFDYPVPPPVEITPSQPENNRPLPEHTPPPVRTQPPKVPVNSHELVGSWEYVTGSWIWFFGLSDNIVFLDFGDGNTEVFESEGEEWGIWYIDTSGYLIIEADYTGYYVFSYNILNGVLTLTDEDGDESTYVKIE